MKVLVVCSGNFNSKVSSIILDQNEALSAYDVTFDYYLIKGRGPFGYLKNLFAFRRAVKQLKPDLVHAHYGLSGALAVMQRLKPVIVTYHGTDINSFVLRCISLIAVWGASKNIFVSRQLSHIMHAKRSAVIPCGVDFDLFRPMDQLQARLAMGLDPGKKYILFSSAFDNAIKNYPLAKKAVALANANNNGNIELLELKGSSRQQVVLLMNAADLALMTSFSEGSPQFIKEALACNTPVITTNVGDVKDYLPANSDCYITGYAAQEIAEKINLVLGSKKHADLRSSVTHFDNKKIAELIYKQYLNLKA